MVNSLQQPEDRKLRVLRQEKRIGFIKRRKDGGSAEDMISQHLSDVVRNIEAVYRLTCKSTACLKRFNLKQKGGM